MANDAISWRGMGRKCELRRAAALGGLFSGAGLRARHFLVNPGARLTATSRLILYFCVLLAPLRLCVKPIFSQQKGSQSSSLSWIFLSVYGTKGHGETEGRDHTEQFRMGRQPTRKTEKIGGADVPARPFVLLVFTDY